MSDFTPYDAYEPNEPRQRGAALGGRAPLAPAGTFAQEAAGARRTAQTGHPVHSAYGDADLPEWNEADYLPNEPQPRVPRRAAAPPAAAMATEDVRAAENPYARLTWDETAYEGEALPSAQGGYPLPYDLPPAEAEAFTTPLLSGNPYARPAADAPDGLPDLSARFAPPLKFELPKRLYEEPEEPVYAPPGQPNVYQTRRPALPYAERSADIAAPRGDDYRVEADADPARRRRRWRALRRTGIVLLILGLLGVAAYLNRAWLLEQVSALFGKEAAESVNLAVNQAIGVPAQVAVKGYDPAPALQAGDGAKRGINAVAGNLDLEPYAVTDNNVVARRSTADGAFEYYLFAARDGQLLGYYEGVAENGFLVCPDDVFYVQESPYLIDSQGLPLIDATRYQQAAGADAVLGPMVGGWSIIHDQQDQCYNFINAKGDILSPLWFAKVFPFTGNMTLAYVDTGNVTVPEERYALYTLSRNGEMKLWKHASDMADVVGSAANMALMANGDLVRLEMTPVTLCQSDDVTAYADCGAVVARDVQSGKYGLFVGGEQQYDFAYDAIAPVSQDIPWTGSAQGAFRLLSVQGLAYPLPLSHYFALTRDGAQEMVALSTMSVYPLLLE